MKIITISGASGSGKSTLAEHILNASEGGLLLSLDRYYLSKKEQLEKNGYFNFDDPAALDIDLLKEHLATLKETGMCEVPIYDFTISERAGYETVKANEFILIDGLFAGAVLSLESNFNVYVDVDLDLALLRRINRDITERGRTVESVTEQYMNQVRPAFFKHIDAYKYKSNFIIENNTSKERLIEDGHYILELMAQGKI